MIQTHYNLWKELKNYMIRCPLLEREIDDGICFDITMVAERMAPERTAPQEATKIDGYREICLNCINHRD